MKQQTQKQQTQKISNPIKESFPINESVKKYLDRLGEIRLSCLTQKGHKIWVRTNSQEGVLAIINDWRSLGFKSIEVYEPPRYGVTQFWNIQET